MKKLFFFFLFLQSFSTNAERSMYVDDFDTVINSTAAKTTLLQYAQSHQITHLILYDLQTVHVQHNLTMASTNQILADFIKNAKMNYGITKIAVAGESASFFQTRIMAYNATRSAANEKVDVLNLEFEFWNTPLTASPNGVYCIDYLQGAGLPCDSMGAFSFCKTQLMQMRTLVNASSHPMTTEMYVGWTNVGQLKIIANLVDRTLIHAYVVNANNAFNYTLARLQSYNTYSGIENITIIYSTEPNFMGPWLNTNGMANAEQTFMTAYNANTEPWKAHVTMTGFTYFTYSMMANIVLPTQLTDFEGIINNKTIFLSWQIALESNISHFEVEESSDGNRFEKLGTIPYNNKEDYVFQHPFSGTTGNYYRLKMLDRDGNFSYSKIIFLLHKQQNTLRCYPNPTSSIVHFSTNENQPYTLYNTLGQMLLKGDALPETLDLQRFDQGVYEIKVGEAHLKIVKD
jgi:hypothetical protein